MARPLLKLGVLFGCVLLGVEMTDLRAANPAEIGIPGATAGAAGARALALVVEGPAFTWPIIVRRNDSGDAAVRVRVDVTPLTGPSAQLADPQRLSMDGQDVAAAEFDLSSLAQKEVRLSGTLPVEGDFTGELRILIVAQGSRTPYDLKVTRRRPANPPKARFVGATGDGKLAMTSDKSAFEWPLILRRDEALKQDVEVRLHASLMSGPSGTIIEPKLMKDGKPLSGTIRLPALGEQSLMLTGNADQEGPYTGELSYDIDGNVTSVTLTLTRTHPDLDFKIEPISKTYGTAGDPVTLQLRLLNNTSTTREIYPPSIVRLERTDTSGSAPVEIGAGRYNVVFTRHDGKPLQPLKAEGDGELALAAAITGLEKPGSYKGVMKFTALDRKPADAPFELSLRLSLWWAVGAIALGVIGAALLRYYQSTGQPRLLLQRDALGLRSKLTTLLQAESRDLTDRERRVFAALIGQIDDASDQLADSATPIATASANIATVRRRLSLLTPWITFRRRHDALRPPSVAAAIEPDLDFVFTALMNANASDADVEAANARLNGLEATINEALRQSFNDAVTALTNAIHEFDAADQLRFDAVATDLAAVTAQTNLSHFTQAEEALARARSKFAEIAAGLLRATLTAATPAVGFQPADWTAFITEIRGLLDGIATELDPERRVQRWTEANRRYLIGVVQRAKARVEEHIAANVAGTAEALTRARAKLVEAQAALAEGKLGTARVAYQEAVAAAGEAREPLRQAGQQMGRIAAADADAPSSGPEVPASIIVAAIASLWPLPLGHAVTLDQVTRRLRWYNAWFAAALLLLAVISGVQLLYFPNPTFGYADLVIAFLWGAGLHAVAGQTFQGLVGLAQQLR
jgi:hypothetical protein